MIPKASIAVFLFGFAGLVLTGSPQTPTGAPDFGKARDEAVRNLQRLIQVDTTNPPGNETKVVEYVKGVLDREGIQSEIVWLEPARANLIARIKGNGTKRPVLLMGHSDVVGVERDKWMVDPFAGIIKDGYLYGRGSRDDKDMVSCGLEVLLLLHRQKIPLDRDIIYVVEAGEEGSANVGINLLVEKYWDKIASEFALLEGGATFLRDGKVGYVGVATTEKVGRGLRLIARGGSGHASMPRPDNAVVHLAAAVAKLGEYQAPMRLNETTRRFFRQMGTIVSSEEAYLYKHLEDPVVGKMVEEILRRTEFEYNSMLRTSISPTIITGGTRGNVIPSEAEANIDIRALPDENMDEFVAGLRRVIDDPAIEIVTRPSRPIPPPSSLDSEMFKALEKAQAVVHPGSITIPMMLTGGTHNTNLRQRGVQSYGLNPATTMEDRAFPTHGNNERIALDAVGKFVELMYRAVLDVAVSRKTTESEASEGLSALKDRTYRR